MNRILAVMIFMGLVVSACGCISSDRGISFGDTEYDVGFQIDRIVYTPTYDDYVARDGHTYAVVIFTIPTRGTSAPTPTRPILCIPLVTPNTRTMI